MRRPRRCFGAQCTGNTIEQSTLTSFWLSQLGFGGHHLLQLGMTRRTRSGPTGSARGCGLGSGADMPRPVKIGKGRIRADVLTTGMPFMGGTAVFTSTAKAHVSPGHACTWERHTHHFTTTRYPGKLTPGASPLEMMFDTGAAPVKPTPTDALHVLVREVTPLGRRWRIGIRFAPTAAAWAPPGYAELRNGRHRSSTTGRPRSRRRA